MSAKFPRGGGGGANPFSAIRLLKYIDEVYNILKGLKKWGETTRVKKGGETTRVLGRND